MLPSQPNGRATFVKAMIGSNLIAPRPGPRRDRPPDPPRAEAVIRGARDPIPWHAAAGGVPGPVHGRAGSETGHRPRTMEGDSAAPFPEIWTNCISRPEVGWPGAIWRGAGRSGADLARSRQVGRHLARPGAIWRESRGGHLEASAGRRWEADLELNGPGRAGEPGTASGRWLRDSIGIASRSW